MTARHRDRTLSLWALALVAGSCCGAPTADDDQRCANAFVLTQVLDSYSSTHAGMHEVYEFAAAEQAPTLVHRSPLLAVYGNAVYLCDQHLFASVVTDTRLKPPNRLTIEEVTAGRIEVPEASWLQRLLGREPSGRALYLTEAGTERVFVRDGLLVVHNHQIQAIPAASAPAGYRLNGPLSDLSMFPLKDGRPAVTVTELLHFDPVARKVVARTPLSSRCSGGADGAPRGYQTCGDKYVLFDELNLRTGARRPAVTRAAAAETNRGGTQPLPSRWWAKGRTLEMNSLQVSDTQVLPQDIFELIDDGDEHGRLQRLGPVPSKTIRLTQGTPDGLLMISPAEKRIWLYDPDTRNSLSAPIALTAAEAKIPSISHTRDHFLVSEEITSPTGPNSTRLLILNRRLELLYTLERPGYTSSMFSSARPWLAERYFDGLTLVPYPGKTVPPAKQMGS
ncbi:MAG: hypothetical protein JHC40_07435 [Burkholderiales bacterium]|jgi:hypothetical protein|nr:hypothetical protein [Burkholderiales bacterium]